MILDDQNLFSDDQAITATAPSEDIIDLGVAAPGDLGAGHPIPLLAQVTEDFNNLTSLEIQVQMDTVENFASPTTVASVTILAADLLAGKKSAIQFVPLGVNQRYVRLNYVVSGTAPTTGRVTAGIVAAIQTNA